MPGAAPAPLWRMGPVPRSLGLQWSRVSPESIRYVRQDGCQGSKLLKAVVVMGALSAQLFEVAAAEAVVSVAPVSTSAAGMATEMEVIAELLRRGRKVAVPVVDDDGVDLVVDYRWRVQVKFSSLTSPNGVPILCVSRNVRRHANEPLSMRRMAPHVDVLVAAIEGVGLYVIPAALVREKRNVSFGPSMDEWRGAWSVFDA